MISLCGVSSSNRLQRCLVSADTGVVNGSIPAPAVENYTAAIRGIAEYASKLRTDPNRGEERDTSPEREYLLVMAGEVPRADRKLLHESRSYVRCVLREYRDESARYVANLRQDMAATARTLREVTRAVAEWDSYGSVPVLAAVQQVKALIAASDEIGSVALKEAAADLECGLAGMRSHHQLIVSQLHTEIQLLQRRMEELTAAEHDNLSKVMPREEIEDRIALAAAGDFRVLLLKPGGLMRAKEEHAPQVFHDLSVAFIRRMRNTLGTDIAAGRWCGEGFAALVFGTMTQACELAEILQLRLSGPYVCRSDAKTVIVELQTGVEVLDTAIGENREAIISRIDRRLQQ